MASIRQADWYQFLIRLTEHEVDFVIIGGVAAVLRGSPVTSCDLEVCASMSRKNIDRIHAALIGLAPAFRFRPDLLKLSADPTQLHGSLNINLSTPIGNIDLLGELPGVCSYKQLLNRCTLMIVGDLRCRVVELSALIAAEKFASRSGERWTIRFLEEIARRDAVLNQVFDE